MIENVDILYIYIFLQIALIIANINSNSIKLTTRVPGIILAKLIACCIWKGLTGTAHRLFRPGPYAVGPQFLVLPHAAPPMGLVTAMAPPAPPKAPPRAFPPIWGIARALPTRARVMAAWGSINNFIILYLFRHYSRLGYYTNFSASRIFKFELQIGRNRIFKARTLKVVKKKLHRKS